MTAAEEAPLKKDVSLVKVVPLKKAVSLMRVVPLKKAVSLMRVVPLKTVRADGGIRRAARQRRSRIRDIYERSEKKVWGS